ncbi:MAG: amidase [Alphaproteobacteria bacterium]
MPVSLEPIDPFFGNGDVEVIHSETGPLAGLTVAVKDIYDVAGFPTGCGNPTRRAETAVARKHAAVVSALLNAGARFAGKTHTVEFAFGMDGHNAHYGTPVNPAAPDRVPGGSSSGSIAAVGLGLVDLALGSDTGGSVRAPASFCGQVGLRTTFGRIDIAGTMPLAESLDTVGWFARDLGVYERVGEALLGEDAAGPPLKRLLVADDLWAVLGEREREALLPPLKRVEPHFTSSEHVTLASDGSKLWRELFRNIQGYEAWCNHRAWIESHSGALSEPVRYRFEVAAKVSEAEYRQAEESRRAVRSRVDEVLGDDGVVVLPTVPSVAPLRVADGPALEAFRAGSLVLTCPSGLSGCPQITLPMATLDGAPMGLSLLAPRGRDLALIMLARQILGK